MDVGKLALIGTSAPLVLKLLGPTTEYLGEALRHQTGKGIENLKYILSNATGKVGEKIEIKSAVPPKVIKWILADVEHYKECCPKGL